MECVNNQKEHLLLEERIKQADRGMTLIQILLIVAALLAIQIIFNPIGIFIKANKSKDTAAMVEGLNTVNQSILTANITNQATYSITLTNTSPPYSASFQAPPVGAYSDVTTYKIEAIADGGVSDRTLTYDNNSQVTYSGTNSSSMTLTDYNGNSVLTGPLAIPKITFAGSNGIAHFVNLSLPKVEEDLVLGLFGADNTPIGQDIKKNGITTAAMTGIGGKTNKDFIQLVVGDGTTISYLKPAGPDRWAEFVPVDSGAVAKLANLSSTYVDPNKYRLFMVHNVASKQQALAMATTMMGYDPANATQSAAFNALYDAFANNIKEGQIIAMPASKSYVAYSQTSDYKRIKFTTTD